MENIQEVLYLGILIFTVTSYGQEDCECPAVVYLQFGDKGTIPCRCDHFSLVSWYSSKENYDDGSFPFIRYDNSETKGTGKVSGQFDLEPDGTLIINNVSMINHEMEYFSVFLRDTEGQTVSNSVKVEVIVSPDPLYPVLNGHMNHQYLYLDMKREGTLYCSMKGVHPKVNLSITVIDQGQQGGVDLQRGDTMYSSNEDHSYDVKVTYNYTTDLSVQMSILQCNVTGELGQHFSEVTTAEISFPPGEKAFPVIDGGIDPEHILLERNRTGEIVCSITSSDPETKLVWKVVDHFSEDKILLDNCFLRALPRGDTFIVSLKCSYVVEDEYVDRVKVQCQVTGGTGHQYQNATTVELLFPKKEQSHPAPTSVTSVIDGCNSKHDIDILSLLTLLFVSVFGLRDVIEWYFNRRMYMESVMRHMNNTSLCDRADYVNLNQEGAKQCKRLDSPDSGNPGSTLRMRRGSINASEELHLVGSIQKYNAGSDQTEVVIGEENAEEALDVQLDNL